MFVMIDMIFEENLQKLTIKHFFAKVDSKTFQLGENFAGGSILF